MSQTVNRQPIQTRNLSFKTSAVNGEHLLAASLDFPACGDPVEYAIVCHCFTCSRQTITTARLARSLAEAGYAVLRLDFTGLGDSEGRFEDSHFSSMLEDIQAAAAFLSQHYQPATLLLGHSMGGTACLAVSQSGHPALSRIRKLVTLASPASPEHVLHHFGPAMQALEQGQAAEINVAGRLYPVKPSFIKDVQSFDMAAQMACCQIPVLAFSASEDSLVESAAADQIVAYSQAPSRHICIVGADHLFSDREHSAELAKHCLAWLQA